jgi:hypothetical protein
MKDLRPQRFAAPVIGAGKSEIDFAIPSPNARIPAKVPSFLGDVAPASESGVDTKPRLSSKLCRDFHVIDGRVGLRDRLTDLAHHLKVCLQCVLEVTPRLFFGVADGGG